MTRKLKEINKAMTTRVIKDHDIIKCWSGDNLLKPDDRELIMALDAIRRRGNGVALLLIEKK